MGRAKEAQFEQEAKVMEAVSLCVQVGAIDECEIHGEYIDTLEFVEPEYLVEEILKHNPDALAQFDDQADMLACVEDAMAHAGEECGSCAKNKDS